MIGILLFLGINFLCFLPTYILNYKNQKQILPFFLFSKTRLKDNLRILFLWKNSSDFFRINFDFSILFLLTLYFDTPPLLLIVSSMSCVLGIITLGYSQFITTFFERDISILNDLALAKTCQEGFATD